MTVTTYHDQVEAEEHTNHYDIPTAVTFLAAGVGVGYVLALLWGPRMKEAEPIDLPEQSPAQSKE
jgi:hypothetical protein